MNDARELTQIYEILRQPVHTPDYARIFSIFTSGKNHAIVKWRVDYGRATVEQIWGDFKGLTSYDPDKCIGLPVESFVDEESRPKIRGFIQHALSHGFVAKKTSIYTESGEIKDISGILYKQSYNVLIELLFDPLGIEL